MPMWYITCANWATHKSIVILINQYNILYTLFPISYQITSQAAQLLRPRLKKRDRSWSYVHVVKMLFPVPHATSQSLSDFFEWAWFSSTCMGDVASISPFCWNNGSPLVLDFPARQPLKCPQLPSNFPYPYLPIANQTHLVKSVLQGFLQ